MKTAYVFLADGFEEMEAVIPIDMMRRADIPVYTVGINGKTVRGAHNITLLADLDSEGFELPEDAGLVLLPGGGEGTKNLLNSPFIANILQIASQRDIIISAICAAPTVLHKAGLTDGKQVTVFPGMEGQMQGSLVTGGPVEKDGKIITGRSAGVAFAYAHSLIEQLKNRETADKVAASVYPEV